MEPSKPHRITRFADFYPFYLGEHQNRTCRRLHFAGSTAVIVFVVLAALTANAWWLLAALICGYAFAWLGHFVFEKNRPATFQYPVFSLMGDWVMYADIWRRRIKL